MANLSNGVRIEATPDKVWSAVGDLTGIGAWLTGMTITAARMEGNKRICAIEGMGEIREDISEYSEKDRSYRYTISEGPLPFKILRGKIAVLPDGKASTVRWDVDFEPASADSEAEVGQMLDSVYKQSLETLRKRFL